MALFVLYFNSFLFYPSAATQPIPAWSSNCSFNITCLKFFAVPGICIYCKAPLSCRMRKNFSDEQSYCSSNLQIFRLGRTTIYNGYLYQVDLHLYVYAYVFFTSQVRLLTKEFCYTFAESCLHSHKVI
jgi:hypothetical protein